MCRAAKKEEAVYIEPPQEARIIGRLPTKEHQTVNNLEILNYQIRCNKDIYHRIHVRQCEMHIVATRRVRTGDFFSGHIVIPHDIFISIHIVFPQSPLPIGYTAQ